MTDLDQLSESFDLTSWVDHVELDLLHALLDALDPIPRLEHTQRAREDPAFVSSSGFTISSQEAIQELEPCSPP